MRTGNNQDEPRHATMADVAAKVGVSRQLVGLVFRNAPGVSAKTTDRILQAAAELNYRPNFAAQSLRRAESKYIGLAFHTDHSSTIELIPAIYKAAHLAGYKLVLSAISPDRADAEALGDIMGHRCDGLILISSGLANNRLEALAATIPTVSISRRLSDIVCGSVSSSGELGMRDATDHLISLGHKNIAYVDALDMFDHEFRLSGYSDAMVDAHLPENVLRINGGYVEAAGEKAAARFLALEPMPTAVICSNDQLAFGFIHCLLKAGVRVPSDVSVIGYDDTVAQLPFLDLTTVRQDPTEMANAAIKQLVGRISGATQRSETVLTSSKLVLRSSTSQPRLDFPRV